MYLYQAARSSSFPLNSKMRANISQEAMKISEKINSFNISAAILLLRRNNPGIIVDQIGGFIGKLEFKGFESCSNYSIYNAQSEFIVNPRKMPSERNGSQRGSHSFDIKFDLHGLLVQEAIEIVDSILQYYIKCHSNYSACSSRLKRINVHFVVGLGRHSANGLPKLKPALMRFLKSQSFKTISDVHSGEICVQL
jgi:hypothetical protein